jgi:DNA-3-methyladenine glycosylase
MRRLARDWFAGDAPVVAPLLLGKILVVGSLSGRIDEVEAYTADDQASHSFRGETPRNRTMFGPAGHLYVYFTYGIHHCANVVTGPAGRGEAVLLRSVVPIDGVDEMVRRRGRPRNVADGPGKLCQAFGIGLEHDGVDLCDDASPIGVFDDGTPPPDAPVATPRIGIRLGTDRLWRWTA